MGTGGTYAYGFATNQFATNIISSSVKFKLYVHSAGYQTNSAETTYDRTIYGTKVVRLPYPSNSTMDETVSGSDVICKFAISEHVSSSDTVSYDIASGLYTKTGVPNNAGTGSCVNNSILGYPKVIGNWVLNGWNKETNAFMTNECFAYEQHARNGKPVACVVITVTDQHSHTWGFTNTAMQRSWGLVGDELFPAGVYRFVVPLAGFTQNDKLTSRFIAYPWVGNSLSIMDTGDGTYVEPSGNYCNITNICDAAQTYCVYGGVVDPVNGSDTTGRVTNVGPVSIATSHYFATTAKCAEQLTLSNSAASSRVNVGGGNMWIKGPTGWMTTGKTYGNRPDCWLDVWPYPGDASAAISNNAVGSSSQPMMTRFHNLIINTSVAGGTVFGQSSSNNWSALCFDHCTMASPHIAVINYSSSADNFCPVYILDCTVTKWAQGFYTGSGKDTYALVRGCNLNGFTNRIMAHAAINNYITVSNAGPNYYTILGDVAAQNNQVIDRGVNYNNYWGCMQAPSTPVIIHHNYTITNGYFFGNNVVEFVTNCLSPAARFDFGTANGLNYTNMCYVGNVFLGAPSQFAYNDDTTSPAWRILWQVKYNYIDNFDIKTDTFTGGASGASGLRIGNWWPLYGYGFSCNIINETTGLGSSGSFMQEFMGLNTIGSQIDNGNTGGGVSDRCGTFVRFINPLMFDGTSAHNGNGDYHWFANSAVHMMIRLDNPMPFDMYGNAFGDRSPIGPFAEADLNK